jgi:hypothetical protein
MGVRVYLTVACERVPDETWEAIYERARLVATRWTPRPLSIGMRQVGAVRVPQYALDIEREGALRIVGDAETLAIGELFVFPSWLPDSEDWIDAYVDACNDEDSPDPYDDDDWLDADLRIIPDGDVLLAVAASGDPDRVPHPRSCDLFGDKTVGFPYHTLIVALGLLVENALPRTAVVHGDISLEGGQEAVRGLTAILGEPFELPVVLDRERMRQRLAGLPADLINKLIEELGPPSPEVEALLNEVIAGFQSCPGVRFRDEMLTGVFSCTDRARLCPQTRRLLDHVIGFIESHAWQGALRERVQRWGTARTREAIAQQTQMSGIWLTSMTWDAIETADLDELAFLYAASCVSLDGSDVRSAIRALFENSALRGTWQPPALSLRV